jgi:hypothetical protein
MSGNIHNTDIKKIKKEVTDLINDLDNGCGVTNKYHYLKNTSKSLYDYIVKEYDTPRFNKEFFTNNLEMMLKGIEKIQKSNDIEKTQHEASILIGEKLASQFIPQLKK